MGGISGSKGEYSRFEACLARWVLEATGRSPRNGAKVSPEGANCARGQQRRRAARPARGHRGWHFPRHEDGRFAGYHPENSQAAIAHLEELRSKGAEYLVFPGTALWWLDYYGDFREHLEGRYRVLGESESCLIYDVSSPEVDLPSEGAAGAGETKRSSATPVDGVVDWLLPRKRRSPC